MSGEGKTISEAIRKAAEECVIHHAYLTAETRYLLRHNIATAIHDAVMAERERWERETEADPARLEGNYNPFAGPADYNPYGSD